MKTHKMKWSSLTFVSRSQHKYLEYVKLLGISDLKWSKIRIVEPQNMNIELLVEGKIEKIKDQLVDAPFFVEHTGLVIDGWKGLPGGLASLFVERVGNEGVCKMMKSYKGNDRCAKALVVIGFFHASTGVKTFHGKVNGSITVVPRGANGFGWDSIFIPDGETRTYAEMSLEEKNQTSMRKDAVNEFRKYLWKIFEL